MTRANRVVIVFLALASFAHRASAQPAPATRPSIPTALPPGWEEIDQRLVFFTVQLASVETSLEAVDKALKQAGYRQGTRQAAVDRYQKGNERMDRNAGGPVSWREFYGKTAERFFYRPALQVTLTKTTGLRETSPDDLSQQNLPGPASIRPPQFDYIYRANLDGQRRAEAEIAKLGGRIDSLVARRRQLESEQASAWAKIAFQAIAARRFAARPIYRFDVKAGAPGRDDVGRQHEEAMRALAGFVRAVVQASAEARASVDNDAAATFDALKQVVAAASTELSDRLIRVPALATDLGDPTTTLGRASASAERLADVTQNIADAYRGALAGDRSGDDQQKQTFRAYAQQALFDWAANVSTTAELASALAKEWDVAVDPDRPAPAIKPSPIAAVTRPAAAPPAPMPATEKPDGEEDVAAADGDAGRREPVAGPTQPQPGHNRRVAGAGAPTIPSGTWHVRFPSNNVVRRMEFFPDGSVAWFENGRQRVRGRMRRAGDDLLLDLEPGKVERVTLAAGRLFIEHFNPDSEYPRTPANVGVGTPGK